MNFFSQIIMMGTFWATAQQLALFITIEILEKKEIFGEFEQPNELKDLGMIMSKNLNWTSHANNRASKALKALYCIKRNLSPATTMNNRKNAYKSYVVPIVSYASSVWKPSKQDLATLEKVQQRATKWILGN